MFQQHISQETELKPDEYGAEGNAKPDLERILQKFRVQMVSCISSQANAGTQICFVRRQQTHACSGLGATV